MIPRLTYTIFLLLFGMCCNAAIEQEKPLTVQILFAQGAEESFGILDQHISEPFFLEAITFTNDVGISSQELRYLTDFEDLTWVTIGHLKHALAQIKRKNKFESLQITMKQGPIGKLLEFDLKGVWSFAKLKINSSILAKDRFKQFYGFAAGDVFDQEKHDYFVKKITQELYAHGYLDAEVTSQYSYEQKTKHVYVALEFDQMHQYKIGRINLSFNNDDAPMDRLSKDRLSKKIEHAFFQDLYGTFITKELTQNLVMSLKKYMGHKGYINAQIALEQAKTSDRLVDLQIDITVKQKKRCEFIGNHFFGADALVEQLLIEDAPLMLLSPAIIADDIKALYKNKGFAAVRVTWKEEPERYFFIIDEGPRSRIQSIVLKQANPFTEDELLQLFFAGILKHEYMDQDLFDQAKERLIQYAATLGYWDAQIVHQENKKINQTAITVIITLNFKEQRKAASFAIAGYPELMSHESLKKWQSLKEPIPLDPSIIQIQRQAILKFFYDQGYVYSEVKADFIGPLNALKVVWKIDQKAEAMRFGKTIIQGANRISGDIILRELQYAENDVWNPVKIDQTIKRLRGLTMFESVSVVPYEINDAGQKSVILKVVEDDSYEMRARVGLAQLSKSFTDLPTTSYRFGGSFLWKNPFGYADIFRLDGDYSRFSNNIALSYEVPWIFNQPIRTLVKGYHFQVGQPLVGGSNQTIYTETHEGISLNFNREFMPYTQALVATGFDVLKVTGLSKDLAQAIKYEPQLLDKREPYFFIEPSLIINTHNHPTDPTQGSMTVVSAKAMVPFDIKNGFFVKCVFEQSFIWPVYKSILAAMRLKAGHIFNSNFNTIMPTERFYLGGPNSIRGYEPNMAPPLNKFCCDNEEFWVPVGGKSMVNLNTELRFPLYQNLSGVLFTDLGVLKENGFTTISSQDLIGASGFGFRYATPLGPVRFDFGVKWKKRRDDDKRYAWYLTFGHTF